MIDNKKENDALRLRSGSVDTNDRLVEFLYEVMRDHINPGRMEMLVRNCVASGDREVRFTNGYLARYAEDLARRLRGLM